MQGVGFFPGRFARFFHPVPHAAPGSHPVFFGKAVFHQILEHVIVHVAAFSGRREPGVPPAFPVRLIAGKGVIHLFVRTCIAKWNQKPEPVAVQNGIIRKISQDLFIILVDIPVFLELTSPDTLISFRKESTFDKLNSGFFLFLFFLFQALQFLPAPLFQLFEVFHLHGFYREHRVFFLYFLALRDQVKGLLQLFELFRAVHAKKRVLAEIEQHLFAVLACYRRIDVIPP